MWYFKRFFVKVLDDYGAAECCFDEAILVIAEGVQFEITFIND